MAQPHTNKSISVTPEFWEMVEKLAAAEGKSVSRFIRDAIYKSQGIAPHLRDALDQLPALLLVVVGMLYVCLCLLLPGWLM